MCGRYTLTAKATAIQQAFDLDILPLDMPPRYNIAPSQMVPVVTNTNAKVLSEVKWGLVPSWAKDKAMGNRLINARIETVTEKPSFRSAFKRRRCLIPLDGFYEWHKQGKSKTPMYVQMQGHELFALAGLWETWEKEGEPLHSCTILTTVPNEVVQPFHHRMAVILSPDQYDWWLSEDLFGEAEAKVLQEPFSGEGMEAYAVSTEVNNVANDHPALIEPYEPPKQATLL